LRTRARSCQRRSLLCEQVHALPVPAGAAYVLQDLPGEPLGGRNSDLAEREPLPEPGLAHDRLARLRALMLLLGLDARGLLVELLRVRLGSGVHELFKRRVEHAAHFRLRLVPGYQADRAVSAGEPVKAEKGFAVPHEDLDDGLAIPDHGCLVRVRGALEGDRAVPLGHVGRVASHSALTKLPASLHGTE